MLTEKIEHKIKEQLFSENTEVVISAISSVKKKGNKLYIPLLFNLLNSNPENEIVEEIQNLLATVKDKNTVPDFIKAIENKKYKSIWKVILTACWQNGLDFSKFLPVFIEIIINKDWDIAFEAFTIIDNLESLPEQSIIEQSINKISAAMENISEQKAYFLREVLTKIS